MKKIILFLMIFTAIFVVGCSHIDKPVEDSGVSSRVPAPGFEDIEEAIVSNSDENVKEFNIVAKKWSFEPAVIEVNKGDLVKLNINSVDVAHGFSISEFGINENLAPGKTATVEFTADKTGEFTFFCSVYCGSGHNDMEGKLIVN